jgi:hypothetical protein
MPRNRRHAAISRFTELPSVLRREEAAQQPHAAGSARNDHFPDERKCTYPQPIEIFSARQPGCIERHFVNNIFFVEEKLPD